MAAKVTTGSAAVRADPEMRADIAHHWKGLADGGEAALSHGWAAELATGRDFAPEQLDDEVARQAHTRQVRRLVG